MKPLVFAFLVFGSFSSFTWASDIRVEADSETGWKIYVLNQGKTQVKVAPEAGGNAFSIRIDGVEYFRQPKKLSSLSGVAYGNPILYPMPNRVKGARFTFRGKEFKFAPNASKTNFIHGLVNRAKFSVVGLKVLPDYASIRCKVSFQEGSENYDRFPVRHEFYMTVVVRDRKVRWEYEVVNLEKNLAVPFGVALHPYFVYQGDRAATHLTIPATHWMESERQLPSGKLVSADSLDYPLGQPLSLKGTKFDDVFFGMNKEHPTVIDFRDTKRKVIISASNEFTHLVVWTPDQPYFGIENQTCSTDAHNLDANGFKKEAHLQVCEPNETKKGWVEYRFEQE